MRKSKGMTQEELGKVLNVTYQAVSKWERGESLPDFSTMSQIAKYFQVPLSYFEDGADSIPEPAPAEIHNNYVVPNIEVPTYIGTCTECGRMLQSEDDVATTTPKLVCKTCAERNRQQQLIQEEKHAADAKYQREKTLREELGGGFDIPLIISLLVFIAAAVTFTVLYFGETDKDTAFGYAIMLFFLPIVLFSITHAIVGFINSLRITADDTEGYKLSVSFIVAGAIAVVYLVLFLILYIQSGTEIDFLILLILSVIVSFTFVSQMMWGSIVNEIFTCGGFTFRMPGFIFSLTVESILWMIVTKIFLGILSILIFLATTVLFALIAIFGSVITFIPCLLAKLARDAKARSTAKKIN
ncbi:MAG: helix-turn-helix domain-containing protein [Clostridiales bacterium]|nr:helix-turn-helix domain-containing protein [Clostridiales bacterium]